MSRRLLQVVRWERLRQPDRRVGDAKCPARLGANNLEDFLNSSARCQRVADSGNRGEHAAVAMPLIVGYGVRRAAAQWGRSCTCGTRGVIRRVGLEVA